MRFCQPHVDLRGTLSVSRWRQFVACGWRSQEGDGPLNETGCCSEPQVYLRDAAGWPGQVLLAEGRLGLKLARKRAAESPKGELDHLLSYFHWWARTLAVLGLEAPRLPGASLRKVWSQEGASAPLGSSLMMQNLSVSRDRQLL